jgi:succinate dehydrogenase/fumarate reductase cytochrome b subunit
VKNKKVYNFYMKKIVGFFLIFFLFTKIVNAQTPPISQCGFADVPGADKCCEDLTSIDINKSLEETKQKTSNIPGAVYVIGTLANLSGGIVEIVPLLNQAVKKCYLGEPVESAGSCVCKQTVAPTPIPKLEEICKKFTKDNEREFCINCARGGELLTAIGCVPLRLSNFVSDYLLKTMIGLAGIISLFCIIYAAFQIQTSSGNTEKVKKAQELLTSCIMGLMLIIFSVFILRLIGVDILKIPGFSK